MPAGTDAKVIGHFAYASNGDVVWDGDACIIAGSEGSMKAYLASFSSGHPTGQTIRKTRFAEIMRGMRLGGAYAFDEDAYNRFYPLAKRAGLTLGPEDFSPTATGRHFVRVQIMIDA